MRWKAVIFDRDGTLFDSFHVILAAFNFAIQPYTTKHPTDAEWFAAFGPAEPEVIGKFVSADQKQQAYERFYSYYKDHLQEIQLFPGMKSILAMLKQKGAKLGIFTGGGSESTKLVMSGKGIADYFDAVITGDRVQRPKPDPEGILLGLSELKVPAQEALVVGDAGADILAGESAGTNTALARWSAAAPPYDLPSRPDYTFYSVPEFQTFLLDEEKS